MVQSRLIVASVAGVLVLSGTALGQSASPGVKSGVSAGSGVRVGSGNASRDTLSKMMRPITMEVTEARLEDVLRFIAEFTGADLEPAWTTTQAEGLDKDQAITFSAKNVPALTALEQVLAKAQRDFQENTWQMTPYGSMQVGPKDILNKTRRLVVYSINDMLLDIPNNTQTPQIDLSSVLQQSQGGGGGGGSPFTGTGNEQDQTERRSKTERATELINLITTFVETNQWVDNGGEAATVRYYNGTLLINAPDYIHRQLVGYAYWPSSSSPGPGGVRTVTLNVDAGLGKVDGFGTAPVTGTAGGVGGGNSGGGGGSPAAPGPR